MNINKLAKLAKKNDSTLVVLVNRWMLGGKNANPIPDVLLLAKVITWGSVGFWTLMLWVGWDFIAHNKSHHIPDPIMPFMPELLVAIIEVIVWWKVVVFVRRISSARNANKFCDTITLIERLLKEANWADDVWESDQFLRGGRDVAEVHLYSLAQRIKDFEKIPWRNKEAEAVRKELDDKLQTLTLLILLPSDKRTYFTNRPQPRLEKMAIDAH